MSDPLQNYVRSHRKLSGLTQAEIAYLLKSDHSQIVSRIERGQQQPDLEEALAFEVVFDVPLYDLFEGLYLDVQTGVQNRAYLLASKLPEAPGDLGTQQKLRTLRRIYQKALEDDD